MQPDPPRSRALFVACLCAEWCGACRDYRPVFDALATAAGADPGDVRAWIDIEDHPEVAGDLDIETFPTLLIADAEGRVRFLGSVTPHAATLQRLVERARRGELRALADADGVALARRARDWAAARPG
jgi:thioredoxin 1